tara:strand:+ start:1153 stop:1551 length:399 start_codon:yes stop_codon:yes gene_type:complete
MSYSLLQGLLLEPKFKEKWLDLLRSDIYKQIRARLGDGTNGRCCLGVAADVAGVYSYIEKVPNGDIDSYSELRVEQQHRLYKDETQVKYDFPSPDMLKRMGGLDSQEASTLAEMNDSGKTFLEIADYIEENL